MQKVEFTMWKMAMSKSVIIFCWEKQMFQGVEKENVQNVEKGNILWKEG